MKTPAHSMYGKLNEDAVSEKLEEKLGLRTLAWNASVFFGLSEEGQFWHPIVRGPWASSSQPAAGLYPLSPVKTAITQLQIRQELLHFCWFVLLVPPLKFLDRVEWGLKMKTRTMYLKSLLLGLSPNTQRKQGDAAKSQSLTDFPKSSNQFKPLRPTDSFPSLPLPLLHKLKQT